MDIENKEAYTLVKFSENISNNDLINQLSTELIGQHVIVDLLGIDSNLETLNSLVDLSEKSRENNYSLIFVIEGIDIDLAPDEVSFAPTLLEATDILEMENLERELMQGDE